MEIIPNSVHTSSQRSYRNRQKLSTKFCRVFSTSDMNHIRCAIVVEIGHFNEKMWEAECLGGQKWEAVGGRGRPCSPDWLRQIRSDLRANQRAWPPTASHFRPPKHSASHIFSCDLSEPIRESEFGLPLSTSHAHWAMQSNPRGHLTDFMAKRIALIGFSRTPGKGVQSSGPSD